MAGKIVVVGSSNTDMILQMDHIPRPGETILGGEFSMAAGGKGLTRPWPRRAPAGRGRFWHAWATICLASRPVEGFRQDGIDVQHVITDDQAPSGVALIFVAADGENSIGVASGANARLSPHDVQQASPLIVEADVLVMQLETPLETVQAAAEIASKNNVTVILNPAPAQPLSDSLLQHVSILTPNESEAELLTGIQVTDEQSAAQAAQSLHGKGVSSVIVTLGARGALVSAASYTGLVPAFPVTPVDTTAAGDVFNGALAVALSQGRTLRDSVRFAAAAAALSVTKLGAQPSAPARSDIESMLASA